MFSFTVYIFWKLFPTYFSHFLPAESSPTWPRHSSAWTLDIKAGLSVVFTSWDSWCPACIWSEWTRCRTDSRPVVLQSPPRPPPPLQAGDCQAPAWCLPLQCDISLCTDYRHSSSTHSVLLCPGWACQAWLESGEDEGSNTAATCLTREQS